MAYAIWLLHHMLVLIVTFLFPGGVYENRLKLDCLEPAEKVLSYKRWKFGSLQGNIFLIQIVALSQRRIYKSKVH